MGTQYDTKQDETRLFLYYHRDVVGKKRHMTQIYTKHIESLKYETKLSIFSLDYISQGICISTLDLPLFRIFDFLIFHLDLAYHNFSIFMMS